MIGCGIIECLVPQLVSSDTSVIKSLLESLEELLQHGACSKLESGNAQNPCLSRLYEVDGIKLIEGLQMHPSEEIYTRVSRIIENFMEWTPE